MSDFAPPIDLFVTHIEAESRLLKIWAQVDRTQSGFVERQVKQAFHHANKGDGAVKSLPLEVGQLYSAELEDSDGNMAYYRAKIIDLGKLTESKVTVQFVDYGNCEVMNVSDIAPFQAIQTPLVNLPGLASEFYLAGIISKYQTWDEGSLETIRQHLRYEEVEGVLKAEAGEKKLFRIYFRNTDYAEFLMSKYIGVPIQLPAQHNLLLESPQKSAAYRACSFSIPSPRFMVPQKPVPMLPWNLSPGSDTRFHGPHQLPKYREKMFTIPVLDINTEHRVYVSFVENGPWSFAVQLQTVEQTLAHLMAAINELPPAPLRHPLMPGSVCLGKFSEDQTLCRAVVTSEMTDFMCMLYYVDFGNSERRSYSDIYELSPKHVHPEVMALRFSLSGLKDVRESDEIKACFKEIVTEKLLGLKVVAADGPPIKQYCKLTLNGQNVLEILLEKTKPLEYKPIQLTIGATGTGVVSCIVNPSHFYIQLSHHLPALKGVMMAVENHCTSSTPPLSEQTLQVGLACCALYAEDGKWYRAQVISILSGSVRVKYVDYGNSDTVSLLSLKKIERNLVSVMDMQAVKCCLSGFEDTQSDFMALKFQELVGGGTLKFLVLGKVEDCFIVDLFNPSTGDVNIRSMLLEAKAAREQSTAQPVEQEKRYEAGAPVTAEPVDEWKTPVTTVQEMSVERVSAHTEFYCNRGTSHYNDDGGDSWRSREQIRSRRSRDDHDKGRKSKERFGEGNRGGHAEAEREQKCQEGSGEQEEFKKKPWARDEDRGGYRARNTDGEGYHYRRYEDRQRNAEDGEAGFYGRRDDVRQKRFNNEDSRRGRDTKHKWKKPFDSGITNSRSGRKTRDKRDNLYHWPDPKTRQIAEEKVWDDDTHTTTSRKIKPPSINIGDTKAVAVIFCTNPQDFYVQVSNSSELPTLMEKITTTYESAGAITCESLKNGCVCIARYAEDGLWYRAVVESVNLDSALVFFCDYGNKENVPLTDIKEIKSEHMNLPSQGIPCSLLAAKPQNLCWSATEIDNFTVATEGKAFEAKFVSQNNGRYDVILEETEMNSTINLLFGGTPELVKAQAATIKPECAYTLRAIIQLNERFSCQSFSPDATEQVSITWFIDPEQFYCQVKSSQAAMNEMMASIQEAYRFISPTFRPVQVGLPIIAKFKADNVLYRAEVKAINDLVTVQFVDYGNFENVSNSYIWDMESRFMNLPKQAVLCTLQGVKPANEKWSQNETMQHFKEVEYQCTFHRFIEEKWEVSLLHSGINVASDLVEAGLAREEILETTSETMPDEEPVEISLLSGQTLKVHVTFVESTSKFFVHLNGVFAQKVQAMVDQHAENPKNLQPMDGERLSVGDLCLASPCSVQWYRAKIIDTAQTTGLFVTFIDIGDGDEVPVNKVMVCPTLLQKQPAQATECALHGLNSMLTPAVEDSFKSEVEDKDMIMKVEAVETEILLVSLYDIEGRKLKILKDTAAEPLTEHLCPLPVLSRKIRVWVSHVNNANSLWLHRVCDSEVFSELQDKLHDIYEEKGRGAKTAADIGSLCAAKSDSFGTWYRARIISINPTKDSCEVLFIDYGNTESLPIATNIKSLDTSLLTPHELAVHISLPLTTSEELASELKKIRNDKEFIAVFSERNDKIWFADLFENNMSLSGKLVELCHATLLPGMEVNNQITESNIELASELSASLEVLVSHFDSPGQFWLQLASNNDSIVKFQENIQIIAESLPAADAAQVGLHCVAQFSEDNLWYRAVVLDINSSYITLRYTDYGNTSQLEVTAAEMKELPEELGSIPDFSFPCCINASPIDGSYWNAEAVARCEELLIQEAIITINVVGEEEMKIVDVFVDGVSVVDVLLKENLAVPRKSPVIECSLNTVSEAGTYRSAERADFQQSGDTVEPPIAANVVADVGDSALVYEQGLEFPIEKGVDSELVEQCKTNLEDNLAVVSHAESLEEFWLQYQSVADLVHQLEYRLLEAEHFPNLDDIIEGKLCAAIFDDDNQWYRAKILGRVGQGTQVKFIDYGNVSVCEDLRKLPADLASLPPMAQHCSLALPETLTEWPPSAKDKFLDLVSDGCKWFEVKVIEKGDPVIVSLTYNGKHIQTEIFQDVLEASASLDNLSKTEDSGEEEMFAIYYMIEKDEYQEDIRIPESSENKTEVPEDRETVYTDAQKIELDGNDKCANNASDKVDDTGVTTVMYLISDGQELESEKEVSCVEHVSDLPETSSTIDKDGKEQPETETSFVNGELPTAEETLMDEQNTKNEKHDILYKDGREQPQTEASDLNGELPAAEEEHLINENGILLAEGQQYIGANDSIAPMEDSKTDDVTVKGNLATDEKPENSKGPPEMESDSVNPKKISLAEEAENDSGIYNNSQNPEWKEHSEELVRKLNVKMIVVDKAAKTSQIDRNTSVSASNEQTSSPSTLCDETGPSSLPEELLGSQGENGATKSEPGTSVLSGAGKLSAIDEK